MFTGGAPPSTTRAQSMRASCRPAGGLVIRGHRWRTGPQGRRRRQWTPPHLAKCFYIYTHYALTHRKNPKPQTLNPLPHKPLFLNPFTRALCLTVEIFFAAAHPPVRRSEIDSARRSVSDFASILPARYRIASIEFGSLETPQGFFWVISPKQGSEFNRYKINI